MKCLSSVLAKEEAKEKKVAYVVDDGLLMWCWADDNLEDWVAVYQVVVPKVFHLQVLALVDLINIVVSAMFAKWLANQIKKFSLLLCCQSQ